MEAVLQGLVDGVHISRITAGLVPAPQQAARQGNHLFVNLLYTEAAARVEPSQLISIARSDLLQVAKLLLYNKLLLDTRSLCVSVYGCRIDADAERLYRYSVPEEGYIMDCNLLTSDALLNATGSIESSNITAVDQLLVAM